MLEFKVNYSLEYYESRSFRIVYQDNPQIKLTDSYSTTSVVINYEDLIGVDCFCVCNESISLDILRLDLKEGKMIYFFTNKKSYLELKTQIADKRVEQSEIDAKQLFCACISDLIVGRNTTAYVIQVSQSQLEKQKQKAMDIVCANLG